MLTDYGANLMLDYFLGNRKMDDIPNIYFGLSCRPMGKAAFPDEPTNTGYERVKVKNTYDNFPRAIGGVKSHCNKIVFKHMIGQCVVRAIFISLAPSGSSKIIATCNLDVPKVIVESDCFLLPGTFSFVID